MTSGDSGPIRILAILDDTVISGKVKPVLTLARYARGQKEHRPLEISMLTFARTESDPDFVPSLRAEGFAVDVVRERRRFDFGVFHQLRAIIGKQRPHVLWTHGAKTHFLVRAGGLHREKAWAAFHHGYTATSLTWRLYDQLDRWSLHGADSVMTACDAFARDLHARLGIRPERLSVHRSPIISQPWPPRDAAAPNIQKLGLPPNARVVLSVGRLSKEKGQGDLIRAMAEVRRMCDFPTALVIVGDGPEHSRLERLCARLGAADAVRMVGYQDDVGAWYRTAAVFALTSYSEGSPNVLLEAIDAGIPIVATAVGGVGEMIRNGEHGLLVPAGDVTSIAKAIAGILSNDDLGVRLTAAARASLAAYAPERYYGSVRRVFERLVDRPEPNGSLTVSQMTEPGARSE
jgi:glycosyltransferase involved in cell wall biosynthesis